MSSRKRLSYASYKHQLEKQQENLEDVSMAAGNVSVNDSLKAMNLQRVDPTTPMNPDPTPDRLALMRMRLLEIKGSMESVDLTGAGPDNPEVPPVLRQRTFTIENDGKEVTDDRREIAEIASTAAKALKKANSNASTCARARNVNVKRLDYYKSRAATGPRPTEINRVHTKKNVKISKEAIKKSLLESLETSTIDNDDNNNNNVGQKSQLVRSATYRASRIPVKIPSYALKKDLDESNLVKLQLPPTGSKIPVSPKFKASFMTSPQLR